VPKISFLLQISQFGLSDQSFGSPHGPMHDVGHEGVASDEAAMRPSCGERTDVETVARATTPLGELAFEDRLETPLAMTHDRAAPVRKPEAGGELAQQLEQRQVWPRA
jgi:hypothetical protein